MITTIKLSGLTCGACQKLIGKRIKSIDGVEDVIVDESGETQMIADRLITVAEVKKILENTPYSVAGE